MDLFFWCALQPSVPLGTKAAAGNLKPMMSASEGTHHQDPVRKRTNAKSTVAQLMR